MVDFCHSSGGNTMTIKELCTKMHDKYGYEYAALTGSAELENRSVKLECSDRPNDALFFSKLCKSYNEDTNEMNGPWIPQWLDWMEVNDNDYMLNEYKHKHIIFAKYDNSSIINLTRDEDFVMDNTYEVMPNIWWFNWPEMRRCGFKGFRFDQEPGWHKRIGFAWDVKTLAVWDTTALFDVKIFNASNSEKGYTYNT